MAEEQKWQEASNHLLCANKCGFFGSPTTLNLCSKCYKDHCLKEEQMSTAKIAVEKSLTQPQQESETPVTESSSSSSSPDKSISKSEVEEQNLCENNCGFFGSPTTLNLCSKCYNDHCLKEEQTSTATIAVEKSVSQPQQESETTETESSSSSSPSSSSAAVSVPFSPDESISKPEVADPAPPSTSVKPQQRNRCGSCRKRVGLTGFKCKCGTTFCGTHRYPEKHDCTFDFKEGKEAIAKANPVVKPAKLEKI